MSFWECQRWKIKRATGEAPSHLHSYANLQHDDVRGFKGLKQAIKLEYKLGRYDKVGSAR